MGRPSQCNPCCEEVEPPGETDQCPLYETVPQAWRLLNPQVIHNGICTTCQSELNKDTILNFYCGASSPIGNACIWVSDDKMTCSGSGTARRRWALRFIAAGAVMVYGFDEYAENANAYWCARLDVTKHYGACSTFERFVANNEPIDPMGTITFHYVPGGPTNYCCTNFPTTITIEPA